MSLAAPPPPARLHPAAESNASVAGDVAARSRLDADADRSTVAAPPRLLSDLVTLTKPRIVVMVLVTAAVAAVAAAGRGLDLMILLHTLLGTALVGASAGTMNQIWEREIDCRMRRTSTRPLPAGRISTTAAALYCAALGVSGTVYLAIFAGLVPAAFGLATWLTYVLIYTPMKTRTAWNTTVGAISGALPMMIGYTAAGGSVADPRGWLLVAVLVAWQYPHFMAIAWMYRREYGAAGFLMTPVVEPSGRSAAAQAVAGALALVGLLVALVCMLASGWGAATLCGLMLLVSYGLVRDAFRFARQPGDAVARRMMLSSLLQLPAAMLVLVLAALWG